MDLREEILKEHSKTQCLRIVRWVGHSQERFNALLELFLHDEYRVVQRASWPLSNCVFDHPEFVKMHLGTLIHTLKKKGVHNAVRRNIMRLLTAVDIPKKYHGEIMNTCFEFIGSPTAPVAVKAFSLTVLQNLLPLYPEILPELKLVIEERWPHERAAFKSRAMRLMSNEG